jgi:hypothetical protein
MSSRSRASRPADTTADPIRIGGITLGVKRRCKPQAENERMLEAVACKPLFRRGLGQQGTGLKRLSPTPVFCIAGKTDEENRTDVPSGSPNPWFRDPSRRRLSCFRRPCRRSSRPCKAPTPSCRRPVTNPLALPNCEHGLVVETGTSFTRYCGSFAIMIYALPTAASMRSGNCVCASWRLTWCILFTSRLRE